MGRFRASRHKYLTSEPTFRVRSRKSAPSAWHTDAYGVPPTVPFGRVPKTCHTPFSRVRPRAYESRMGSALQPKRFGVEGDSTSGVARTNAGVDAGVEGKGRSPGLTRMKRPSRKVALPACGGVEFVN